MIRLTKTERACLLQLTRGSSLYTSNNTREWVRLSARGLVERRTNVPFHKQHVELTEAGRSAVTAIEAGEIR